MRWVVEYYERTDTTQPAEEFETSLCRNHKKLGAKLRTIAAAIEKYGPELGGGLIEPCYDYRGLWEIRTILNGFLGRELFGFDGEHHRVVLLHGYVNTNLHSVISITHIPCRSSRPCVGVCARLPRVIRKLV